MEEDTHDKLVKAYLEYFRCNEWWVRKRSHRSYYETQQNLREIRSLAKQLINENLEYFNREKRFKKDQGND